MEVPVVADVVPAQADNESSVHAYEGFPRGTNDPTLLTGYVDHVEFI